MPVNLYQCTSRLSDGMCFLAPVRRSVGRSSLDPLASRDSPGLAQGPSSSWPLYRTGAAAAGRTAASSPGRLRSAGGFYVSGAPDAKLLPRGCVRFFLSISRASHPIGGVPLS